jgi:hypothetical protein
MASCAVLEEEMLKAQNSEEFLSKPMPLKVTTVPPDIGPDRGPNS